MPDDRIKPDAASFDRRSADIGIVCTQNSEIRPLIAKLDRRRRYVDNGAVFRGGFLDESIRLAIVEAGPGFARHRQVTQTLIKEHHPAWVLSVGFSSALTEDLKAGDVCLASEICDRHGNSLPVKCSIPESRRVFVRKHVVADRHPRLQHERTSLAESTDAAAVDTTSLAVAQACQGHEEGKPAARFLSLRAIVGGFHDDLSEKIVTFAFEPGDKRKLSLISKLGQKLKRDPELIEWGRSTEDAAFNLNRFLLGVLRQLGEKLGKSRF